MENISEQAHNPALPILFLVGLTVIASFYFGRGMKYIKLPSIIGYVVLGVILGPSGLSRQSLGDGHASRRHEGHAPLEFAFDLFEESGPGLALPHFLIIVQEHVVTALLEETFDRILVQGLARRRIVGHR